MSGTIHATTTQTGERPQSLLDPASKSSSPRHAETLCLYGRSSAMQLNRRKRVYAARSSETKVPASHLTLSERLTPLLISAGLVKGTTRRFGHRLWRRGIPAGVSYAPDGRVVEFPKVGCLFSPENQ
jgi:hypothetical protein